MSPRAKNRLLGLLLLAALVGGVAYTIARQGPEELLPRVEQFFRDQDEGRTLNPFQGSMLHERWDPPALLQAQTLRERALGRFVKVPAPPTSETWSEGGKEHQRLKLKVVFEKREAEAVFTFRREGSAWMLLDFAMPLVDMASRPRAEDLAKKSALDLATAYGERRLDVVLETLTRTRRMALSPDDWKTDMGAALGAVGTLRRTEATAWRFEKGRGHLEAELTFDEGVRRVELDVVFEPSEGRWVLERFAPAR